AFQEIQGLTKTLPRIISLRLMGAAGGGQEKVASTLKQPEAVVEWQGSQSGVRCRHPETQHVTSRAGQVVDHFPDRPLFHSRQGQYQIPHTLGVICPIATQGQQDLRVSLTRESVYAD